MSGGGGVNEGAVVVVFGATGMVGSQVLAAALDNARVARVVAIGRRETAATHAKLEQVTHGDFLDYGAVEGVLAQADAVVFCLAAYQAQVSKAEYEEITVGYPAALIAALERVNPDARFVLFGAAGAKRSAGGVASFAAVKGRAEVALVGSGLARRHIFRPGLIVPAADRRGWWWPVGLLRLVFRVLPWAGIEATDLGRAMVAVAVTGDAPEVVENRGFYGVLETEGAS